MQIQIRFIPEQTAYLGPELRPHFLLEKWKIRGSALAAFVGPCEVKTGDLVDWEDRLENDFIRAKLMVHFLGEFFGISLSEGVLYQRLFMATAGAEISRATGKPVSRDGDDLFWFDGKDPRKLSVSIVTASPVSVLLHAGINLDAAGAPVKAAGLFDLGMRGLNPSDSTAPSSAESEPITALVMRILELFQAEVASIEWACAKVRPVV
ncbi:MAG: DUF366 family protein [Cryobacterium sp.]|nr:DUF366 family protein [Oligoflexia bacterium]